MMARKCAAVLAIGTLGVLVAVPVRSFAGIVLCQRKKRVAIRVDACKANEQLVSLPTGPIGATGASGATGDPGPIGPPGPAGADAMSDSGCPGPRVDGVCLLSYSNASATSFTAAALQCASAGGDLCTDSQAWPLSVASVENIYLGHAILTGPHWTASFSDNDSGAWSRADGGTGDNNTANSSYGFACCGGTTPTNPRVPVTTVNNVKVVAIHDVADTRFSGAAAYCAALAADVCSDSQTLLLRDGGALTVPAWTSSHADNDALQYGEINGGTNDDTTPADQYGFACCPSLRPSDLSCPVARTVGVCATVVHNAADADFRTAAQACAAAGADLCSIAQAALLHTAGALTVATWTNSHSDNDAGNLSSVIGPVADNPSLSTSYGYACCLN